MLNYIARMSIAKDLRRAREAVRNSFLRMRGIHVGRRAIVSTRATLSRELGGSISIGAHTHIHDFVRLESYGGDITIGDYCSINPFCILYGHGGLAIGRDVRIAAHVVIVPANHVFADRAKPIREQGLSCKGIVIGDDVWIGAGARILDGVKIANGSVIGAGAVVTRSTEPYGVYVGSPARLVAERGGMVAESRLNLVG
jgi:acetyltransferase-like isoleucine patch superfamily enzyme